MDGFDGLKARLNLREVCDREGVDLMTASERMDLTAFCALLDRVMGHVRDDPPPTTEDLRARG